jgi:hypothetical protein
VSGQALTITAAASASVVRLHYRHVNQAENYVIIPMERQGDQLAASIPASYTQTEFPLEYFFDVKSGEGRAALYPGFTPDLTNQPYFVVHGA